MFIILRKNSTLSRSKGNKNSWVSTCISSFEADELIETSQNWTFDHHVCQSVTEKEWNKV
ncbi:hypothetical protein PVAP13_1NG462876 [Panicum virgatum]|uniref:Uncharacterized protein n=1 Tax=Panicum virgatum TaxID=38727 RepID=A0A8T0WNF6_PANVG|nr:hypothetical protein PVAP13_1NG462876 [Panicum virgatum]